MPRDSRSLDLQCSPEVAKELSRSALQRGGFKITAESDWGFACKEPFRAASTSWPVKLSVKINSSSATDSAVLIDGSIGGLGPIQSRHLNNKLDALEQDLRRAVGGKGEGEASGNTTDPIDSEIAKLNRRAQTALRQGLPEGEAIQVVVRGAFSQAMVGTKTRVFVVKPGYMAGASFGAEVTSWGYVNLLGVQIHKSLATGSVVLQAPGQSGQKTSYWGQGQDDPAKAPNAIPVTAEWDLVKANVAKLQSLIDEAHAPRQSTAATDSGGSTADELKKLAELRDSGVLSESEFADAKRRLLDKF